MRRTAIKKPSAGSPCCTHLLFAIDPFRRRLNQPPGPVSWLYSSTGAGSPALAPDGLPQTKQTACDRFCFRPASRNTSPVLEIANAQARFRRLKKARKATCKPWLEIQFRKRSSDVRSPPERHNSARHGMTDFIDARRNRRLHRPAIVTVGKAFPIAPRLHHSITLTASESLYVSTAGNSTPRYLSVKILIG